MSRIKRKYGPGGGIQASGESKSRKDRRKEARSLKKQNKMKKYLKNKDKKEEVSLKEETLLPPPKAIKKPSKKKADAKKQADKNRKRRLQEDNESEEANIKALSKKLGLNKRKSKKALPQSFLDDGLDFLLDAVDSEKLQSGLIGEDGDIAEEEESHSDFDESDGGSHEMDNSDDENETDFDGGEDDDGIDSDIEEDIMEDNECDEENAQEADIEGSEEDDGDVEEDDDSGEDLSDDGDGQEEDDMEDSGEDLFDDGNDTDECGDKVAELQKGGDWEDIYGRKRDAQGNVLASKSYIPPALRVTSDESTKSRLKKKMKGLLNRLAESNMQRISHEIESLFATNSRRDTNTALSELLSDACVSPVLTPERLSMEHALLVAILNANVGNEVGAHFLHHLVTQFIDLYGNCDPESKELDCYLLLISNLYAFKVVDSPLIFDILSKHTKSFQVKDVELILLLLKNVGFNLRKDDPAALKNAILDIQSAASTSSKVQDSRTKFMIEILMAIKNNNVKKIPNYDPELQAHYKKIMKGFLRPGASSPPLSVRLDDLLKADQRGRWWIVGSAWSGHDEERMKEKSVVVGVEGGSSSSKAHFSSQLLDLARKMRMNTSSRKDIFCNVMSSEDYMDAFERLMKLKNIPNKEKEVAFVLQDCCLQEKTFNPFYFQVMSKLSFADRKYRMAAYFSLWDKIKDIELLSTPQRRNLSEYTSSLILKSSIPLSVLKVITFADINKPTIAYLKSVLSKILLCPEEETLRKVLGVLVGSSPLKDFRESITIFMKHFMGKSGGGDIRKRIALSEAIMSSKDSRTFF